VEQAFKPLILTMRLYPGTPLSIGPKRSKARDFLSKKKQGLGWLSEAYFVD
jgi:hypothetical protein